VIIRNLYDSHVHLIPTGQMDGELQLGHVSSISDLAKLNINKKFFRKDWLIGFGWDENNFSNKEIWTPAQLDQIFPSSPVYFSRCDGHAGVTNNQGLRILKSIFNQEKISTAGLFKEELHYKILEEINKPSFEKIKSYIIEGTKVFHRAGFTHIRDMGGSKEFWQAACELEASGDLHLHIDWNFVVESADQLDRVIADAKDCLKQKSVNNKVAAIKLYFDGSLGSDTALISEPYKHLSHVQNGQQCWSDEDFLSAIKKIWQNKFDIAVHVIGDLAADKVVNLARQVASQKMNGKLHLEHVELLKPETIRKMKSLHVTCYMQPCHWLTDKKWLEPKLGQLSNHAFQWHALEKAGIPLYFGSDSPIEKPSIFNNMTALNEAQAYGVKTVQNDIFKYHCYPSDAEEIGETHIENQTIKKVIFRGETVFSD
jgi:predicted amidohydrolase YtcJ